MPLGGETVTFCQWNCLIPNACLAEWVCRRSEALLDKLVLLCEGVLPANINFSNSAKFGRHNASPQCALGVMTRVGRNASDIDQNDNGGGS